MKFVSTLSLAVLLLNTSNSQAQQQQQQGPQGPLEALNSNSSFRDTDHLRRLGSKSSKEDQTCAFASIGDGGIGSTGLLHDDGEMVGCISTKDGKSCGGKFRLVPNGETCGEDELAAPIGATGPVGPPGKSQCFVRPIVCR